MVGKWDVEKKRWKVSNDGYTVYAECDPIRIVGRCQTVTIANQVVKEHNAALEPEVEKPENVYEYIRREFKYMMECWPVTDEVERVLSGAQEKYGDNTDSVSESDKDKSSMLEEKWECHAGGVYCGVDGHHILYHKWKRELSAAPGAYRALVNIRDGVSRVPYHAREIARAALKKAGIV